ncbi:MAG: hypothetical protein P4L83_15445 [Nevskia sp.]|nr:hypothetical protein [Nevskia sp.]
MQALPASADPVSMPESQRALWRFRYRGRVLGPYPWHILLLLHQRGSLPDATPVQPADGGRWIALRAAIAAGTPAAALAAELSRTVIIPPPMDRAPRFFWSRFLVLYALPVLALIGAFYWVIYSVRDDIDPRPWWLALAAITMLIPFWYAVGSIWVWATSGDLAALSARVLSRLTVVALGLALVLLLATNYRPLKALVGIATRADPFGQFAITFEDGGHTLSYAGPFGYAAPARLQAALRSHPGVDTVVFDSVGGWMVAGRGIARVLRQAGIHTVVAHRLCASACILAFESAPLRVLETDAALGFHSESNQFSWAATERANDSFVEVLGGRGVPQAFVERAIQAPPGTLWRPSIGELFRNGVIDRVRLQGRDLTADDYFPAVVDQYLKGPEFEPLARGLQAFAPAHLRRLRNEVVQQLRQDAGGEPIGQATLRAIESDEQLALERAGDFAQLQRAGLFVDLLRDFSLHAPELCYPIWTGREAAIRGGFTPAQQHAFLKVMGDMLVSAAENPRPPPSDVDGEALMAEAIRPAYLRYGRVVFEVPAARKDGRVSDDMVCGMALLTFEQIHAMRPSEAGAAMRWLAHGKSPAQEPRPGQD